ncbi:hypothetical protein L0F63_001658, partial [Massospora cicadina]
VNVLKVLGGLKAMWGVRGLKGQRVPVVPLGPQVTWLPLLLTLRTPEGLLHLWMVRPERGWTSNHTAPRTPLAFSW